MDDSDINFSDVASEVSERPRRREGGAKLKGRGHKRTAGDETSDVGRGGTYEAMDESEGPVKSVEGWIVFVSNVHEEAQEDDVIDKFGEFGQVKNIHVNLDRRTGFVKGYALIEYAEQEQAESAISDMNGHDMYGQSLTVDWAFHSATASRRRRST
mmetsp:Transcript_21751/g.70055  ORF Transcript_21751/g.70055 Transcript_21751/m.70055 type:complete len:156 (+) Transcript_21751:2-469(+)